MTGIQNAVKKKILLGAYYKTVNEFIKWKNKRH